MIQIPQHLATEPNADPRFDPARSIRAPRGSQLHCKSWLTEAAYRMLQNNLDAEVAENPQRLVVYGGMGRAPPLAASFAGAVSLVVECQQTSIDFRLRTRYLDKQARDIDEALALIRQHKANRDAVSIGLLGNAAEVLPELVRRAKEGGL